MKTRNILAYYFFILVPFSLLVLSVKYDLISFMVFLIGIQIYAFLYHPYVSGLRLLALNKLEEKDFWRMFIPFWNTKFYKNLFLDF